VSRRRTTFGKLQRDRDKQAKQRAKEEKRHSKGNDDEEVVEEAPVEQVDQSKVLDQLAKLHEAYDDGQLELDDFEARRAELTSLLHVE
jgi:hypothetical protein